jgi:hypothetical protein
MCQPRRVFHPRTVIFVKKKCAGCSVGWGTEEIHRNPQGTNRYFYKTNSQFAGIEPQGVAEAR